MSSLRQWLEGRTLLVTGSGSIGSEICRQLLGFKPKRLVLVDRSETGQFFLERQLRKRMPEAQIQVCMADILDRRRIAAILREQRPQIVFHAAAYKHVPLMESHAGEAVKNIVSATRRLADLAPDHGVESFVMISTDKAVNPTSVMGACKRAAEMYVQSLAGTSACRFMTVRFGNVLDSAGSVVPVFRQQIAAGGPVTVTDPRMERFFMTIPEAARLVIQAGVIGNDGEILLLDMGEPVRIIDLAADMIRLSGLRVGDDIEIEISGLRPGETLRGAARRGNPRAHAAPQDRDRRFQAPRSARGPPRWWNISNASPTSRKRSCWTVSGGSFRSTSRRRSGLARRGQPHRGALAPSAVGTEGRQPVRQRRCARLTPAVSRIEHAPNLLERFSFGCSLSGR